MKMKMKMSDAPKGATHWQPKTEFTRECFYKKVPSGVSRYIVATEDERCNAWRVDDGRGETSIIEVVPVHLINNRDQLEQENAALKKANAWHANHTNELHEEIAELREMLQQQREKIVELYSNGSFKVRVDVSCVLTKSEELLNKND